MRTLVALAALFAAGCLQGSDISTGGSAGSGNSAALGTSASSASASATGASASGTTTAGATSSSSAGPSSTGGGTTSTPLPPIVDGGYVFCTSKVRADGGAVSWMCIPGTYLCNLAHAGSCFQCDSDADCANRALPTYDPNRLRCDLTSGIPGYDHSCQQCLSGADCAGNPAGPFCDTTPSYPPKWFEPPIETMGFEACRRVPTDCRLDAAPK